MADFNRCRHTPSTVTHVRGYHLRPVAGMLILSNDLSDIVVGTNHGRNSWPRTLGCISQKKYDHKNSIYNIGTKFLFLECFVHNSTPNAPFSDLIDDFESSRRDLSFPHVKT